MFTQNDPSFSAISAATRIGHMYQMQHLVLQAVDYLKRHLTDDLAFWGKGTLFASHARLKAAQAIGIVNLARLVDEPSLLPAAFLICCSLDEDIVNGCAREDDSGEMLSRMISGAVSGRARAWPSKCLFSPCRFSGHPSPIQGRVTRSGWRAQTCLPRGWTRLRRFVFWRVLH